MNNLWKFAKTAGLDMGEAKRNLDILLFTPAPPLKRGWFERITRWIRRKL